MVSANEASNENNDVKNVTAWRAQRVRGGAAKEAAEKWNKTINIGAWGDGELGELIS